MNLIIHREQVQPKRDDCTLGLLFIGDLSLVTMERPWFPSPMSKGGIKGISCVPPGVYKLVRHDSEAHPRTWALVNEDLDVIHFPDAKKPNARTAVLLHPGNFSYELRGCLAPGTRACIDSRGLYMVQESRKAMKMIQDRVSWTDEHELVIS